MTRQDVQRVLRHVRPGKARRWLKRLLLRGESTSGDVVAGNGDKGRRKMKGAARGGRQP
jgi:hypothetical protein